MASIYKRKKDRNRKGSPWRIAYVDENGRRRDVRGCADRTATEQIARQIEANVALRLRGVIDPSIDQLAVAERRPIGDHLDDWNADLLARGDTPKHVELFVGRARR